MRTALTGDTQYNSIVPSGGNDTINGGTEVQPSNLVDYNDASAGVTVDLIKGTATGGSGSDTIAAVADVYGSAFDDVFSRQRGCQHALGCGRQRFDVGWCRQR